MRRKQVIVNATPCTGSTAIYQIIKDFGFNVQKKHEPYLNKDRNTITIIPVRDLRAVVLSHAKRQNQVLHEKEGLEAAVKNSVEKLENSGLLYASCRFMKENDKNSIIIRYENFLPNKTEKLVRYLCESLHVNCSEDQIISIAATRNIKFNKQKSDNLEENYFKRGPFPDHLHPNHITSGGSDDKWKEEFTDSIIESIKPKIDPVNEAIGYPTDDW